MTRPHQHRLFLLPFRSVTLHLLAAAGAARVQLKLRQQRTDREDKKNDTPYHRLSECALDIIGGAERLWLGSGDRTARWGRLSRSDGRGRRPHPLRRRRGSRSLRRRRRARSLWRNRRARSGLRRRRRVSRWDRLRRYGVPPGRRGGCRGRGCGGCGGRCRSGLDLPILLLSALLLLSAALLPAARLVAARLLAAAPVSSCRTRLLPSI